MEDRSAERVLRMLTAGKSWKAGYGCRMCREGREGRWEGAGRVQEQRQRRAVICVHSGVWEVLGCVSSVWHVLVIQCLAE